MTRLFLSLGKRDRISAGDIVGMLHNECHLERGDVGKIRIMPGFSLIDIKEDAVLNALQASKNSKLRGKKFKLDYDRQAGK